MVEKPAHTVAFGVRFRLACEKSADCPPKNYGRYTWIAEEFARRTSLRISIETVRKWHEGETQAKRDKTKVLATILGVDPVWLETGVEGSGTGSNVGNREGETINLLASHAPSNCTVPVTIRPDTVVEIRNIPADLTAIEAQRIANIILAYALPL